MVIARIYGANLISYRILPLTFADPADCDRLAHCDVLNLTGLHDRLAAGKPIEMLSRETGRTFLANCRATPRQVEALLAGSLINTGVVERVS